MQSANASCPIFLTPTGRLTDLSEVLHENAPLPIEVTDDEPIFYGTVTLPPLPLYSVSTPPDTT